MTVILLAILAAGATGFILGGVLYDRQQAAASDRERAMGSWSAPVKHAVVEIAVAEPAEPPQSVPDPGPVRHSVSGTGGHRKKRKRGKRR